MKKNRFIPVAAGCLAVVSVCGADFAALPKAALDRGGLTYDFDAISRRWRNVETGTNYFAGFSWEAQPESIHLFGKDLAEDAPARGAVKGLSKWTVLGHAVRVVTGKDMFDACGGDVKTAGHLKNECYIYAELPDAEGGDYELSFRYAGGNTVHMARESYWMVGYADRPGARWGGATWHPLDDLDGAVHEKRVTVRAWRGKRAIKFGFEFNGIGDFRVESVSLSRCVRPTTPISVRYAIPDGADGVFAIGEGQVGLCLFEWRANTDEKWDPARFRIGVKLPSGVELRACNFADIKAAKRTENADGSALWMLEVRHDRKRFMPDVPRRGAFSRHTPFQLLLAPAGGRGKAGDAEVFVMYDGKTVSDVARITCQIIARVEAAAPRRLLSGMNTAHCIFEWNGAPDAQKELARMMADAGMRIIHWPKWQSPPGCDEKMLPVLRDAGFTSLMPYDCSLCDGYLVGEGSTRPKNERFVGDVKTVHIENASCPIAIYAEMPHILKYFTNSLPRILKGADGLWANWEPYFFNDHGCWCERCLEAFIAYSGLDAKEVKRAWPEEMKAHRRYSDLYKDFRSKEHAKVVRTVDKWVRRYTGGEKSMGFAPGIAWCELGSNWRSLVDVRSSAVPGPRERTPRDYVSSLEWIEPWGPYPRWDTKEAFYYSKCRHLIYWAASKDVREQLDRDCWGVPKPKLMAYPSSKQGDIWICQPEHLAMAFDAFYVNGWRSVVAYFFPMGYDARYWAALAVVNARMARYEDWLIDGRRLSDSVEVTPVAEYAMPADYLTSYIPSATNVSMLQTAAFRKDGITVVAALNYWEKGEAFFDLKINDLAAGKYAVVDERGVIYAGNGTGPYWTAAELAEKGVRLSVGAVRTRMFEIRPAGSSAMKGVVSRLTAEDMKDAYLLRRDFLRSEAERDAVEEKARRAAGWHPPET